jgi:hypothetical protein
MNGNADRHRRAPQAPEKTAEGGSKGGRIRGGVYNFGPFDSNAPIRILKNHASAGRDGVFDLLVKT